MKQLDNFPLPTPRETILEKPQREMEATASTPRPFSLILEFQQGNTQIRPISGKEAQDQITQSLKFLGLELILKDIPSRGLHLLEKV